jgi:hypothetical protein
MIMHAISVEQSSWGVVRKVRSHLGRKTEALSILMEPKPHETEIT